MVDVIQLESQIARLKRQKRELYNKNTKRESGIYYFVLELGVELIIRLNNTDTPSECESKALERSGEYLGAWMRPQYAQVISSITSKYFPTNPDYVADPGCHMLYIGEYEWWEEGYPGFDPNYQPTFTASQSSFRDYPFGR